MTDSRSEIDQLLGKYERVIPVDVYTTSDVADFFRGVDEFVAKDDYDNLAEASHACLEQWAQGRGLPPRLTAEEIALRDVLGLQMEVFGD